jgi:hypothetical protein
MRGRRIQKILFIIQDRQIERIALTVFSVGRFVLENALDGVIPSLFGTLFTTERTTVGGPAA